MNKILIVSTSIELQASIDKDNLPFIATITFGGQISDKFVGGTENIEGGPYRVLIPTNTLEDKIKGIEGKKVFATDELDGHTHSMDIGEFVQAWVEPIHNNSGEFVAAAKTSGIFHRQKNPELVDKIVALARKGMVGFSYDLKEVQFELQAVSADEKVVKIDDFKWRGATVLLKEMAAYQMTQLAARKQELKEETLDMDEKKLAEMLSSAIQDGLATFKTDVIDPGTESITTSIAGLTEKVTGLEAKSEEQDQKLEAVGTKIDEVSASQSTDGDGSGDPPADPPAKDGGDGGDQEISFKELTAGITKGVAEAVVKANEGVIEKLGELTDKLEAGRETNTRRSHGQDADLLGKGIVSKFVDGHTDEDEITMEGLEAATAAIKKTVENKSERMDLLNKVVAAKRMLHRTNRRGGGYVQ